ncbi:hypothetical protein GpartN1_g375.t1 [Galdieria partita]|uniref:Uncharacterized protein n=1 Tax=Galdieria partita TaxID=83374 RepID=A0A9C7PQX9_9RHOD|nr:hypothetical protein GpartN1_g375.t1 [Galdieria partita]
MIARPSLPGFYYDPETDRYYRRTRELSVEQQKPQEYFYGEASTEKNRRRTSILEHLKRRENSEFSRLSCAQTCQSFLHYFPISQAKQEKLESRSLLPRFFDFDTCSNSGVRVCMLSSDPGSFGVTQISFDASRGVEFKRFFYIDYGSLQIEFARHLPTVDSSTLLLCRNMEYQGFVIVNNKNTSGANWVCQRKSKPCFCLEVNRKCSTGNSNILFASGHCGGQVHLENIASERSIDTCRNWKLHRNSDIVTLDFIDSNSLVAASRSGEGSILDSRQKSPSYSFSLNANDSRSKGSLIGASPLSCKALQEFSAVIFGLISNRLELWDLRKLSQRNISYDDHHMDYFPLPISVSTCLDLVTCGSTDNQLRVWDLKKGGLPIFMETCHYSTSASPICCSFLSGHPPVGILYSTMNSIGALQNCCNKSLDDPNIR